MGARGLGLVLLVALVALVASCTSLGVAAPTPAEGPDVPLRAKLVWDGSYLRDIQPIFDQYCIECHGPARAENGVRLDIYEGVMRGTNYGPVVIPGSPAKSTLMAVIKGTASEKIRMPHKGRQLSPNRIQNIALWIEAGAKKD